MGEIASLAEDLGCRHFVDGKVDLEKIAKKKRIQFIHNDYGEDFLGQLVHLSKKFYIVLNTNLLSKGDSGRIRFTIAHELGHYFIDSHRAKLSEGISLSFKGDLNDEESKSIEIAANHFAAHLLMPKRKFKKLAHKLDPGLSCVLDLKNIFDTSIECTVKHYINLNISASIMIRWRSDCTYHYASYSKSFSTLTGIKHYPPIKFDVSYIKGLTEIINSSTCDYIESATLMSRWFSSIAPGSDKDITGLEQTIKLGAFGGITLLTFTPA